MHRYAIVLAVATADNPGPDELREIGRLLLALVGIAQPEPVDVERLRSAADEPQHNKWVRFAIGACADAVAAHELPDEVQELGAATLAYNQQMQRSEAARSRLTAAINQAIPALDERATERFEARAEATASLSEVQRADGFVAELWPSPESIHTFPREVLDVLERGAYAVPWLLKVVEDLARLDADHRIITKHVPIKTRIAKALRAGGYGIPAIASATEPFAKPGRERRQALNKVRQRLKSKTEELLFPRVRVDPSAQNAAALRAELEESAMFVAGVGTNVIVVGGAAGERRGAAK
jgi:hypothetical protein